MNDPLQDVEHHRRILAKAFRLIIDHISEEERDNSIPLIVSSLNCRVFVVCNLNIICNIHPASDFQILKFPFLMCILWRTGDHQI